MGIKDARMSRKLTQTELADKVGVKRSAVAMWETGKSKPRVDVLIKMSELFHCTIDELIAQA